MDTPDAEPPRCPPGSVAAEQSVAGSGEGAPPDERIDDASAQEAPTSMDAQRAEGGGSNSVSP